MRQTGATSVLRVAACAVWMVLWWGQVGAIELSKEVFPSEDELLEALNEGVIDYELYRALREIAQHGIDSANVYLLDLVPNLSHFLRTAGSLTNESEEIQKRPFVRDPGPARTVGTIQYRYLARLDDEEGSLYRARGSYRFGEALSLSFGVNRELSGRERFVGRRLTYRSSSSVLRKAVLGTYSCRFGLGTTLGYRGRLLQKPETLETESFLFPDYGGYNGVLLEGSLRSLRLEGVASFDRDDNHSIAVLGASVERTASVFRPALSAAVTRIENRLTDSVANDVKVGATSTVRYAGGYMSVEISGQTGDFGFASSSVLEGRHSFRKADLRYAMWAYGDRYTDLTSGSKAAPIYRTVEIEEVGLDLQTKRSGQEGGLLRTTVLVAERTRLVSSVLHGQIDKNCSNTDFATGLKQDISDGLRVSIVYLSRVRRRTTTFPLHNRIRRCTRAETRFRSGQLEMRSYIAYNTEKRHRDYLSVLFDAAVLTESIGRLRLWSNLSRLNEDGVMHWYVFLENEQSLLENVSMTVKLAHTYDRVSTDGHLSTVSVTVRATI